MTKEEAMKIVLDAARERQEHLARAAATIAQAFAVLTTPEPTQEPAADQAPTKP